MRLKLRHCCLIASCKGHPSTRAIDCARYKPPEMCHYEACVYLFTCIRVMLLSASCYPPSWSCTRRYALQMALLHQCKPVLLPPSRAERNKPWSGLPTCGGCVLPASLLPTGIRRRVIAKITEGRCRDGGPGRRTREPGKGRSVPLTWSEIALVVTAVTWCPLHLTGYGGEAVEGRGPTPRRIHPAPPHPAPGRHCDKTDPVASTGMIPLISNHEYITIPAGSFSMVFVVASEFF